MVTMVRKTVTSARGWVANICQGIKVFLESNHRQRTLGFVYLSYLLYSPFSPASLQNADCEEYGKWRNISKLVCFECTVMYLSCRS